MSERNLQMHSLASLKTAVIKTFFPCVYNKNSALQECKILNQKILHGLDKNPLLLTTKK